MEDIFNRTEGPIRESDGAVASLPIATPKGNATGQFSALDEGVQPARDAPGL